MQTVISINEKSYPQTAEGMLKKKKKSNQFHNTQL